MINAHSPTHAASDAAARSGVVRLARRGVLACALLVAGIGAAQAQHRDRYRDEQPAQQQMQDPHGDRGERFQPMPRDGDSGREQPRFDPRSFDSREFDDVRHRRQQQQQMQQEQNARNAEAVRRSRMTPDERRDLRRQINEAGMDLYPKPPRH